MKEKIEQVNHLIEDKKERIKEKAGRAFDAIDAAPSEAMPTSAQPTTGKIPPISYILYGIAGVSAICSATTDSKLLCAGVAAASAWGGYKFSKNGQSVDKKTTEHSPASFSSLKTEVTSKVLEIVKKATQEWEEFMEQKQKEIQQLIETSSIEESEKGTLRSKVFVFEVINIRLYDFLEMMSPATNAMEVKQIVNTYKDKLLKAIDQAASKQKDKYSSLMSGIS